MRISAIETVRTSTHENLLWVLVETDDGHRGPGETFSSDLAPAAARGVTYHRMGPGETMSLPLPSSSRPAHWVSTARASFSAFDPFGHCHDSRGL
jgi:hypothetical protein